MTGLFLSNLFFGGTGGAGIYENTVVGKYGACPRSFRQMPVFFSKALVQSEKV